VNSSEFGEIMSNLIYILKKIIPITRVQRKQKIDKGGERQDEDKI
jgi:hypothetical protein